jgi:hypothetical protein
VQFTREKIPDADLCFVKKKVDSIRASFRKELRRVWDSSIITAAATCFDELILDTEMYEQSSESAHACVVKYIQVRLAEPDSYVYGHLKESNPPDGNVDCAWHNCKMVEE